MKKHLQSVFALFLFCAAFGCAVTAFGQIRVGGFKTVDVKDVEVRKAVAFALKAKSKQLRETLTLDSIVSAERQVVQGVNYRLCIHITSASQDPSEADIALSVKTVVYRDLKGLYRVTSWNEEECEETEQ